MNLAGILLHALPEHIPGLLIRLAELNGVEVHAVEAGKLVVTVEHDDPKQVADSITALSRLERVLTVATVYEYSDKEELADETEQT